MLKKLINRLKNRNPVQEVTWTISGQVRDYGILSNMPGTVLIMGQDSKISRYYIADSIHHVRQNAPIGSWATLRILEKDIWPKGSFCQATARILGFRIERMMLHAEPN